MVRLWTFGSNMTRQRKGQMPNSKAKQRKQKRLKLNEKWKKEGRTAKQHKKWLKKQDGNKTNLFKR